jgi:hypothetical protein
MVAAVIGVGVFSLGCGADPAPSGEATAAIRGADEVGAEGDPQAAFHLQLARDQVASAERLNAQGDEIEARRMLKRAQADAEVAIALAGVGDDRDQAEELNEHINDMNRNQL